MIAMKNWTKDEIKDFRLRLGVTQVVFSAMLGVTRVYVNYLESGKSRPSKTLRLLLSCLENKVEVLTSIKKWGE